MAWCLDRGEERHRRRPLGGREMGFLGIDQDKTKERRGDMYDDEGYKYVGRGNDGREMLGDDG